MATPNGSEEEDYNVAVYHYDQIEDELEEIVRDVSKHSTPDPTSKVAPFSDISSSNATVVTSTTSVPTPARFSLASKDSAISLNSIINSPRIKLTSAVVNVVLASSSGKRPLHLVDSSSSTESQHDKSCKLNNATPKPQRIIKIRRRVIDTSGSNSRTNDQTKSDSTLRINDQTNSDSNSSIIDQINSDFNTGTNDQINSDPNSSINDQNKSVSNSEIHDSQQTKHVSFSPSQRNNNHGDQDEGDQATPPPISQAMQTDDITDPEPDPLPTTRGKKKEKRDKVFVPEAAAPAWNAQKRHRGAQQKAKLRADHFASLLELDCIPSCMLGAEKLPRYLLHHGSLPEDFIDLIKTQGRERTRFVIELLRESQTSEGKLAGHYESSTKDLFKQVHQQDQLPEAEALLVRLITNYRSTEKRRLETLAKKELEKNPNNNQSFSAMMVKDMDNYVIPRSQSRSRSRSRSAPRNKTYNTNTGKRQPTRERSPQAKQSRRNRTTSRKIDDSAVATTSRRKGRSPKKSPKKSREPTKSRKDPKPQADPQDLTQGLSAQALSLLQALNELGSKLIVPKHK